VRCLSWGTARLPSAAEPAVRPNPRPCERGRGPTRARRPLHAHLGHCALAARKAASARAWKVSCSSSHLSRYTAGSLRTASDWKSSSDASIAAPRTPRVRAFVPRRFRENAPERAHEGDMPRTGRKNGLAGTESVKMMASVRRCSCTMGQPALAAIIIVNATPLRTSRECQQKVPQKRFVNKEGKGREPGRKRA